MTTREAMTWMLLRTMSRIGSYIVSWSLGRGLTSLEASMFGKVVLTKQFCDSVNYMNWCWNTRPNIEVSALTFSVGRGRGGIIVLDLSSPSRSSLYIYGWYAVPSLSLIQLPLYTILDRWSEINARHSRPQPTCLFQGLLSGTDIGARAKYLSCLLLRISLTLYFIKLTHIRPHSTQRDPSSRTRLRSPTIITEVFGKKTQESSTGKRVSQVEIEWFSG